MNFKKLGVFVGVPAVVAALVVASQLHPGAPGFIIAMFMSVVLMGIITAVLGAAIITQEPRT